MRGSGIVIALSVALAFPLASAQDGATHDVAIEGYAFAPATLDVEANATVRWSNADDVAHSVAFASDEATTGCASIAPNATCEVAFPAPGEFAYACGFHANMTGTIRVAGAPQPPPNEELGGNESNETPAVPPPEQTPPSYAPRPPVARFVVNVTALTVFANASNATDEDGTIVAYDWSWGDGNQSNGALANHTYAAAGAYNVTLVVTDDVGLNDTRTIPVTLVDLPPTATFDVGVHKLDVRVDASNSSDLEGPITSYRWEWGDGATSEGNVSYHTYAAPGKRTINLTVIDAAGQNATVARIVDVPGSRPPNASIRLHAVGVFVRIDASGSSDPDDEIVSYQWDMGDGTRSNESAFTHEYAGEGTFTVRLTVTDEDDHEASATQTVTIRSFDVDVEGLNVTVDATHVTGSAFAFLEWDFGDGKNGTGARVKHVYDASGNRTIRLLLTAATMRPVLTRTLSVGEPDDAPANATNATRANATLERAAPQESKEVALAWGGALAALGVAASIVPRRGKPLG